MRTRVNSEQMAVLALPGTEASAGLRAQCLLALVCPSWAVPPVKDPSHLPPEAQGLRIGQQSRPSAVLGPLGPRQGGGLCACPLHGDVGCFLSVGHWSQPGPSPALLDDSPRRGGAGNGGMAFV